MFKNMSIGTKLMISFLVVSGITLIVGLIGFFGASKLGNNLEEVAVVRLPSIIGLSHLNEAQTAVQRAERTLMIKGLDQKEYESQKKRLDDAWMNAAKGWKIYEPLPQTKEEEILWKEFVPAWEKWKKDNTQVITLLDAGKRDDATILSFGDARASFRIAEELLGKIVVLNENVANEEQVKGIAMVTLVKTISVVAMVLGTGLSVLLGFFIGRSIKRPLAAGVQVANRLAEGDLTVEVEVASNDETGKLLAAMKIMAENLRNIIGKVADTSSQVAAAANQLHSTSEQIATGAEEVAAQSATVATAGEEMSATSSDIAQNCQMAAEAANLAAKVSHEGQAIALKTTEGIKYRIEQTSINAKRISKLGERTDQIGTIIGTIEDIADQTNLLALNAAIEAARAGEQGRGFAVVADEVRALAERTTRATKEIGDMIKAIQQETKVAVDAMEQGVKTSQTAIDDSQMLEDVLQQILARVDLVTSQVSQIATAAEEQTATTSEISSNMQQITEVVQTTSQGAHESATAAAQLNGNAEELQRLVRQFKLHKTGGTNRVQESEATGWARGGLILVSNPA
jgi:methyl-accepting chemotaxis protein